METDEPPVASGNVATPRAGSIVKDKKKKLKAVFRKRHHGLGNLSIRNSTLNSTIFKTSLKINNRALAQALERKKSECRAAEAIILKQKEELQMMTAEVNNVKMFSEKTKRFIQERLRAVSATMHLAVDQLAEAMDACTDGEFRKLSGPLLPLAASSSSVLPSVNEQVSLQPVISNIVVRPVAGPSRVIVPAAAATTCDDDDDEDEDLDVIASMNPTKEPAACDDVPGLPAAAAAASNLSIIMEQSYLVPSETDLPYDEPGFGYRRSSSRDRRNMVMFQPSVADSPAPLEDEESSSQGVCVRGKAARSRSRKSFGLPIHEEMNMIQDAGVARSKSRDRRNAMIFHPSIESPDADRDSAGKCVRILRRSRNPSGQFPEAPSSAVKTGQGVEDDGQGSSESRKIKESVAMAAEVGEVSGEEDVDQLYLDETILVETEVLSSKIVGQLGHLQNLAKNGEIGEGNGAFDQSTELVDETIITPSEDGSCVAETVMETDLSQLSCEGGRKLHTNKASVEVRKHSEHVGKCSTRNEIQQKSGLSDFAATEDVDDLVNRGQFVTRDKIARTPVKVKRFRDGEEGSVEERAVVRQSGDYLSDISDRESMESEYRRSRSLSRRDIPTFLPIDSPNASGTASGTSKRTVPATRGQAKSTKFVKSKVVKKDSAGPAELKDRKRQNKPGLVSNHDADAKSGVVCGAGLSKENAGVSRRGTFALPRGGIQFLEADIMMEDDSVLINESFKSCSETGDDVFVDADPPPGDEGRDTTSNRVASQLVEHPSNVPGQSALAEKNVTILMAEDMEQTGVSFTAISIGDPPAGIGKLPDGEVNDLGESCPNGKVQGGGDPHSHEKQQVGSDELVLREKNNKLLLPASSESVRVKTTGKICKDKNKEAIRCNEVEARDEGGENDVEQTSNAVKRRRVAHSRLKLPGSGFAATKRGTVFDDAVQGLADVNRKKTEAESESEENPEQSVDIDTKKRCAAYLSKPGNIVFNADRKDGIGSEVAKKSRSKTRSILPLQQKPRSKATATSSSTSSATSSAKPEDVGASSVWDFKGTPRLALAKENADRLLSVYDISLNDSGVIPKPKDEAAVPAHCPKKRSKAPNEFSKDDSFIVDKKPSAGKRRVRHESTSAIDCLATFASESESVPKASLESPHGIMLVLGNGKRRKPSVRSKTVRYDVTKPQTKVQAKDDADEGKTDGLPREVSKDADGGQLALEKISGTTESDGVSKLKPAGSETVVTIENSKERSTQETGQLDVSRDILVADLADDEEEEAESISGKDVRLDCGKSKGDVVSHSARDLKNLESHNSKEITHRNHRVGEGTVKGTENVVVANDNTAAAANIKGSDAGKKASSRGKGVVNPRKEITTKDGTNSKKGSKNTDSKGSSNFAPLRNSNTASSDTASSQSSTNLGHDDDDDNTVLYANKEQTSASDRAAKTDLPDAASSQDSLKTREPNELGQVNSEQEPVSLRAGNAEQQTDTESPQQIAVQRRARKRRVIQSTDLFEDIDTQSLHSPKPKQPALAKDEKLPVTLAGVTKALLKPDNHRQVDSPTARRSQSELPKPQGAGNARRDHNSLRLHKNPKSASTKAAEINNAPEVSASNVTVFPQFDPPLGTTEKTSDSKRKSSDKDLLAVPPRRRTNLSIKNSKEGKTSQRKSSLPKEERALVSADALQRNVVVSRKDLVLLDVGSSEDRSKKKRSVAQNRQSSISTGSCDTSSHSEMAERRTRRNAAQAVSYKEPSLGKKLRRGDPHTSTIYGGANPELEKHHGSERTSDARLSRKVLSSVQNTSMESME